MDLTKGDEASWIPAGLPAMLAVLSQTRPDHLTVFDWRGGDMVELASFHVTTEQYRERVHVYYREEGRGAWRREGHTPTADMVARRLVTALRAERLVT